MSVVVRLSEYGINAKQAAQFKDVTGTTPAAAVRAMYSNQELARLLALPVVRSALADIRSNPDGALERWQSNDDVMRALDLLEQQLCTQGRDGAAASIHSSSSSGSSSGSDGSNIIDVTPM